MTKKQMRQMGIDPDDFDCILEQEEVMDYLDDFVLAGDDEEDYE